MSLPAGLFIEAPHTEDVSLRVGSHGLVFLIGGHPFIFGFFVPTDKTGKGNTGDDRENLQEGDRVIKTLTGNKIILHSHGEIEIQASTVCKHIFVELKI